MKVIKTIFILIACAAAIVIIIWKFAPPDTIRTLGSTGPTKILCQYPVKVSGDAMAPAFTDGQTIILSKCITDPNNIAIGTVVLYERPGALRLSVIRERLQDDNGTFYRLSQEARQNEKDEVRAEKIIAVYEK